MLLGYLNARIGNEEVRGVMGKYRLAGRNVSGESLLELCSELELAIGNTYFRKKGTNKFTWQMIHNGCFAGRPVMDYVIVEKSALGRLVDAHVPRGARGRMFDHFLGVAKVKGVISVLKKEETGSVQTSHKNE